MSLWNKKSINYHIKGLYKRTCYKIWFKVQFFSVFSFLIDCWIIVFFFSFLIKAFADFEKLIRFHGQAFTVHKNGENLKILIEIFCQKLIVSSVILAFLNHLKPKNFFDGQQRAPLFKTSESTPEATPSIGFRDLLEFDFFYNREDIIFIYIQKRKNLFCFQA